jgi:hypothetical protein
MRIEYCSSCLRRVCDSDFVEAKAFRIENEPYCLSCKETLNALPQNSVSAMAPKRNTSSARLKPYAKRLPGGNRPVSNNAPTPDRGAKPVYRQPSNSQRPHKHAETTWFGASFLMTLAVVSGMLRKPGRSSMRRA